MVSDYVLAALNDAVLSGNGWRARKLAAHALTNGTPPAKVLQAGLIAGIEELGAMFQRGERYVPEMMVAPQAMSEALGVVRPALAAARASLRGRVVIGTVQADTHSLGKTLVALAFEGAGFEVIDLGVDVPPERFAWAAQELRPHFVLMSASHAGGTRSIAQTVRAIQATGMRPRLQVGVGGGAATPEVAARIGADFWAPDARQAVVKAAS